jgi:hypothetical protein
VKPRGDEDLKLATLVGFFLLADLSVTVEVEGRLLKYSPRISVARRSQLVCKALREQIEASKRAEMGGRQTAA